MKLQVNVSDEASLDDFTLQRCPCAQNVGMTDILTLLRFEPQSPGDSPKQKQNTP